MSEQARVTVQLKKMESLMEGVCGCLWVGGCSDPLVLSAAAGTGLGERTWFISYVKTHPKLAWAPVT